MSGGWRLSRRAVLAAGAALMIGGCSAQASMGADASPADPVLAAKAQDIGAIREIKRLQHLWGHYADAGQWRDMAGLFASGGVWTDGTREVAGRQAIADYLRQEHGGGEAGMAADRLNLRLFLSPVITLAEDGRSAVGRWHEVAMTGEAGASAAWAGGIHVIDYALTGDGWKIAQMRYHPQFAGPYDSGWSHVAPDVPKVDYHYTPDEAGTPIPRGRSAADPASAAEVAAEAELLLAASAVQNLQSAYGSYLDRQLYDQVSDLFAEDAIFDIAGVGRYSGREGVRQALLRFGSPGLQHGELNDRPQLMPVITMAADGNSATLRNIEIGMTGQHGGASFWSAAIQQFTFQRGDDGIWRIAALHRYPRMRASYESGWQQPLSAALPAADNASPIAPSRLSPAAYPAAVPPPLDAAAQLAPEPVPGPAFAAGGDTGTSLARAAAFDGAENISNAYGYYIDEFEWDGTADLFSTDGWKELSYIGTYIGRERVRGSLVNRYGRGGRRGAFMAIHQKTQPYVTVSPDGSRANIRLRLFQFNSALDGPGSWISGIYENQAVLEDGIWKIHGMDLDYVWLGDYDGGWAGIEPEASRQFAPEPEDVAKYPPDAPLRGVTFAPFPEIAPMGFHFVNPVSGRPPETRLHWSDGRRAAGGE